MLEDINIKLVNMEEEVMSKVHVWVGYTTKTKLEFSNYFKISKDAVNEGLGGCLFCKDININWYDDDLIGVYKSDSNDDLQVTLDELPISPEEIEKVYSVCLEKNVVKANALFYYADANIVISNTTKKYNGLTYIGCFCGIKSFNLIQSNRVL